jgi:hypothetical protein
MLEWRVDPRATGREPSDPNARTYDFLKRLDAANLELLDDTQYARDAQGRNPYDSSAGTRIRRPRR